MDIDIKSAAKLRGVTILELANRLGVSRQTGHYYCEQGDKNPLAQLERIAAALGVQVVDLFERPADESPTGVCPHCGKPIRIHLDK